MVYLFSRLVSLKSFFLYKLCNEPFPLLIVGKICLQPLHAHIKQLSSRSCIFQYISVETPVH